ncbi:MAG: DUF5615 family PIN-like protein [Bacteroidota bacterium]
MILLTDEDFDVPIAGRLRARGLDVVLLSELGLTNQGYDDKKVLQKATELGRTLVTYNRRDFRLLHELYPDHAGIIICKRNTPVTLLIDKIVALVESTPNPHGQLFRIIQG